MKQRRFWRMWVVVAAAMVAISACSSSASPTPAATGGGTTDTTVYFGSGATPGSPEDYLIPVFTTARDILKTDGYDLQYSSLATDEVVEAALTSNRIDVALLSMVGLQRALKAGLHMKWIVTNETQNTFVMVVHKDVTDLTQLKGKKIGAQDPTSLTAAAIPGLMGDAGLQPSDYTIVYLAGSSNRAAALSQGSMDASMMLYTIATQLVAKSNGEFKIWGGGQSAGTPQMWEGLVASDAFRADTAKSQAFVSAVIQAYKKFYTEDPATIAKDAINRGYNELQGLDEASTTADMQLYQGIKLFPTDGGVAESYFTPQINTLIAANQLKQADVVPYADAVDASLVAAAK